MVAVINISTNNAHLRGVTMYWCKSVNCSLFLTYYREICFTMKQPQHNNNDNMWKVTKLTKLNSTKTTEEVN